MTTSRVWPPPRLLAAARTVHTRTVHTRTSLRVRVRPFYSRVSGRFPQRVKDFYALLWLNAEDRSGLQLRSLLRTLMRLWACSCDPY